jgi:hypothetical protein
MTIRIEREEKGKGRTVVTTSQARKLLEPAFYNPGTVDKRIRQAEKFNSVKMLSSDKATYYFIPERDSEENVSEEKQ